MRRIENHPILGKPEEREKVTLYVDGESIEAFEGEPIAVALMASGHRVLRYTNKHHDPRGIFCALGRCTDCMMIVNGQPNVRTCITPVRHGMVIETQAGQGQWLNRPSRGEEKD
jgi:predicted molibdopterin-dependent oxidoreductase YjgC